MRLNLPCDNGKPYLQVVYEGEEWLKVEKVLVGLKLELAKTTAGFGRGEILHYYRETNAELKKFFDQAFMEELRVRDDINAPVFEGGVFNIALFRIKPDKNNKVNIPLHKIMNIAEVNDLARKIGVATKILLGLVVDKEIKLVFK